MHANSNELAKIRTGLAQSVLREIAELLSVLVAEGETGAIDLHGLPMTPADSSELEESLGRGDVEAILNVAGTSEVWETRYSGVWWVRHFGADDKIAVGGMEIAALPEILLTDNADIAAAAERLREDVGSGSSGPAEENAKDA